MGELLGIFAIIWIGWPLYSISADLRALRKMAEGNATRKVAS